jgi:ribosomal-protein-alanine N-acetyltransferase
MTPADLDRVMELEDQAFTNPWSRQMVRSELDHDWSTVLLAEETGPAGRTILGFAIFWVVVDELHILNVAVDRAVRRQGLGRKLMDAALAAGRQRACRISNLEVRRSNTAAIKLYESLGFRAVGMRPAYYQDDREDAVVMILDLYPTTP